MGEINFYRLGERLLLMNGENTEEMAAMNGRETMSKSIQLRNHIPLSAPATREPCTGEESYLRLSLGFTPKWYRENLGIDFSEEWHLDPLYRYKALSQMKTALEELFPGHPVPGTENFKQEDRTSQEAEKAVSASISGVYGIMLMSGIYGIQLVYRKDNWPDAVSGSRKTKEELKDLPEFDEEYLLKLPIVQNLFKQMEVIHNEWGPIHGYLNYQGTLNIAMKVMGSEIFTEMILDPDFVYSFLAHISRTIERISKMVQAKQRESGFSVNLLSMSNCTVSMISPEQFRDFVLPHDKRLSYEYERFGMHTCNWVVDPYREEIRKIERMGYIDTGAHSDLKAVNELFPHARRAVIYTPGEIESKSENELYRDFDAIRRDYGPCDVVLADVESTVDDKRIRNVIEMLKELSSKGSI